MGSLIEGVRQDRTYWYRADRVQRLVKKLLGERARLSPTMAGDTFYMFYLPFPRLNPQDWEGGEDDLAYRRLVLATALADAKTWRIKAYTVADTALSSVAASVFNAYLLLHSSRSPSSGGRGSDLDAPPEEPRQVRKRVAKALREAQAAVSNASALKTILARTGAGNASSLQFEDSLDIMLELSRRTDVAEIARILSRIEISRLSSKRSVRAPRGWFSSVELGSDFERVHPSQLALPEDLFLAGLANGRLLLYRKELPAEDGPVYVLLDKSGSMSGEKINWARAVALALLTKSRAGRRAFYVRVFDSIAYELMSVGASAKPREVMELIRYLATVKASGGTNIMNAVAKAVEDIESREARGVGDIILITDGEDKLSVHLLRSMLSRRVRLHTVMIKGDNSALREVSSNYMRVEKLDEGEALRVVRFAFS